MIDLTNHRTSSNDWSSSKGNQMKWLKDGIWYKADYVGYEGLSETLVSQMLMHSNLKKEEYVIYESTPIKYGDVIYNGCSSVDFLPEKWQLITLERLFMQHFGESLYQSIHRIQSTEQRLIWLVDQVTRITGLQNFGVYMSKIMAIDAFFLNEDRHTHNIAVLLDNQNTYHLCPLFDHGAALLSDMKQDYPLGKDLDLLIKRCRSKTFSQDFDEQLEIAEKLYGRHLEFELTRNQIVKIVETQVNYPTEIKERVSVILVNQMRKYGYMFRS